MLILYLNPKTRTKSSVPEKLKEMVVAHRVIDVADGKNLPKGIRETDQFPVLKDNGKMVQGEKEILRYLEEYKKLKDEWDKFQSDACYCDDEGNIE